MKKLCFIAASLALLGTSCGGAGGGISQQRAGDGPGGTTLPDFPQSQDFYRLPGHFPSAPPGTLQRVQTVGESEGATTLRVMYHSRNASGHDALVTGLVTYPMARPHQGGWPVVAWDHGTSGISQSCAPSRMGGVAPSFGVRGVSVATDYLGLGPDGEIHPYLNRVTEAEATIDIVRAARQIPDAHASATWAVIGDSQGGHASLATGEVAPKYASELHLEGTVAIAPGAVLAQTFPGDSQIIDDVIEVMALYGAQAADPSVHPDQVLVPAAQGVASVIKTGCDIQIADYLLGALSKTGHIFTTPPLDTPQGRTWVKRNDVPQVRTASPILVIAGGQDAIVVPGRIDSLMSRLCSLGDRASVDWYPDGNHSTEAGLATTQIRNWIDARLEGFKAPTSCP